MKISLSRQLGSLLALVLLAGCTQPPLASTASTALTTLDSVRTTSAMTANNVARPSMRSMFDELPTFNGLNGALDNDVTSASSLDKSLANAEPLDGTGAAEFRQTGRASWYGKPFHGRRTASGERYNMHALTAAHRTLPLGSYARVTNPATQRTVIVRINDRGPYAHGRVLDLSYAAANVLGLRQAGTAKVEIEGLTPQEAKAARNDTLAVNVR
ncbi:septal ring lytic transglycosylase RlpA family protein [Paraburkholderia bonniea]|uniref:septal ring lytic transglycosylase RlpA family protein n=1 Tax=Paraburkholderia bonniea TaxID=2152891 RepID=UPI00129167DF|nr:septal ring lytic transglycosylase RlpA family protein [Paraburkholderia bonniea]